MTSTVEALQHFWQMATAFPLLGGVLLAVPGGRIDAPISRSQCTFITPATDPEHLVPWVDLEASLLAGRRVERPGLLHRPNRSLLILQRAHDLDVQAAQHIAHWFDVTPPAKRPPILAIIDAAVPEVPYWLDCRLAFRWAWEIPLEPQRSWSLSPSGSINGFSNQPTLNESKQLMLQISAAAAARQLRDPRYDMMACAAAFARARLENRAVETSDVLWAVRQVLDPRAQRLPEKPSASPDSQPQTPTEDQPATRAKARKLNDLPDGVRFERSGDSQQHANEDSTNATSNHQQASISPEGDHANMDAFHSMPIAPTAMVRPPAAKEHPFDAKRWLKSTTSQTSGRFGNALPHSAGRRGRKIKSRPTEHLDLAATLRAAAPWQPLRPKHGNRVQIYPQDLRYRLRERRPGTICLIVLDASASMWARHLAQAKGVALHLVEQAYRNRSRIVVISARGAQAELLVPPSRRYSQARRGIQSLEAGGSTPLLSALHLTLSLVSNTEMESQPLVYVLTDGRNNVRPAPKAEQYKTGSQNGALQLIAEGFAAFGALVTVIGTGAPGQDRAARQLAHSLGGAYQSIRANRPK